MSLKKSLSHFRAHQEEFVKEHYGQFVLIHEKTIEGFYDDELEAYRTGKERFPAGSFLIRKCIKPEEETKVKIHSRAGV